MSVSPSLEQRVGRAAGEAWLLDSGENPEYRPAEPLGPDYINGVGSVEQYLALRSAGYADEELLVFGIASPRWPATVTVRPNELPKIGPALRFVGIDTSWLHKMLRGEQQRGQVARRLGAAGANYSVRVGVGNGWLGKKLEVRSALCTPTGLCLTKLGCAALDYCVGTPSDQLRSYTKESGLPDNPQELGIMIEAWNLDPRNNGLPRLPLPASYSIAVRH